jgi:hypothetical protein
VVGLSISLAVVAAAAVVALLLLLNDQDPEEVLRPSSLSDTLGRLGCSGVQTLPDEGGRHVPEGTAADHATIPATSGAHTPSVVAPEPAVLTQDVTPELETRLVHNLEHAYVLLYYQPAGPDAPDPTVVETLANIARTEAKVLLAPYPRLEAGTSVALVAWTRLVECPPVRDLAGLEEATLRFVAAFRGTSNAPEPTGP